MWYLTLNLIQKVKVTQSCLTLCDPHGLYSPWNSPGQNTGVGSLFLLQGIFPTQGSNPGLPHCRWILQQLSHQAYSRCSVNSSPFLHHIATLGSFTHSLFFTALSQLTHSPYPRLSLRGVLPILGRIFKCFIYLLSALLSFWDLSPPTRD